jgi:hypothetical protein
MSPNLDETKLLGELKSQIEFYLSDANIYNDRYLREYLAKTQEQRLPFEELLKFNQIK